MLVFTNYRPEPRFASDTARYLKYKKTPSFDGAFRILVALIGIEPILLAELDFESSASTSSATEP